MKTGVQQIMLGKVCRDEMSAKAALERIKAAGYDGIELNRFMIHPSSMMVRMLTAAAGMPAGNAGRLDWAKLVSGSGLEVISLHTDLSSLEKDLHSHIEETHTLKTNDIVITGMYRFDYTDEEKLTDLTKRLNAAGRKLKENGVRLLYHNHNIELCKTKSGKCAYDLLMEESDPDFVNFEFDSYWFTEGGADAAAWMEKLGSRMKKWHITDRGPADDKMSLTPIVKCDSRELGQGCMDLKRLYAIAEKNETEAVVLESHRNWIDKDPLKSMELSAKWLAERRTK